MNIDQFLAGLRATESGGSYSATGPYTKSGDRAYGRYQVMGSNVPGWTLRYYGKSLSPNEFLANHAAQDAVVKGVIGAAYKRYGSWEAAAAVWFSGQPNPNSTASDGYMTVRDYVNKVMRLAGSDSSAGGPTGAARSAPTKDTLNPKQLAEQYGFASSMLNAYPELQKLFNQSIKNGWDQSTFQAKLRNTQWWKTHSQTERDYITLGFTDKATANQKYNQAYTHVQQVAEQLGVTSAKVKKQLGVAAYNLIAKGWTDEQLKNYLGTYVIFDTSKGYHPGGEGEQHYDSLMQYSYSMGIKNAPGWYADWSRKIVRGLATEDDAKADIRKQAKAHYSRYATQIDAGQTVTDLAQPYIQSMQNILEINPGSISLFDGSIQKALTYKQKGAVTTKPIWQFEQELRADPRWKKTKNAQDSLMGVAHGILQEFGLRT